jgi:hypothetical protein
VAHDKEEKPVVEFPILTIGFMYWEGFPMQRRKAVSRLFVIIDSADNLPPMIQCFHITQ